MLQPGEQAGRHLPRVERAAVGMAVRQRRQHLPLHRGHRDLRAERHPGHEADPRGLGKQADRGQVAKLAYGEPEPEQRRATRDQHFPAGAVVAELAGRVGVQVYGVGADREPPGLGVVNRRGPGGGGQHGRDCAGRDALRQRRYCGCGGRRLVVVADRRRAAGLCHGPHLPMLGVRVSGWRGARAGARVLGPMAPGPASVRVAAGRPARGPPASWPGRPYSLSMLRYTASRAAFCSSSRRESARITDSTAPGPAPPSPRAVSAPCSSRPASASSVSADKLSASASNRRTRTDGWCRPRSIWLRYGFERLVSSASWRSDRFASLRWLRIKLPRVFIWASQASVMVTSFLGCESFFANDTEHNDRAAAVADPPRG